ncbi:flagellar filament capping protein FliD [Thalassotalea eurytherma]|uniref:Flagellar hook-associated protein 2 n=1 Tax=Thalassotalea eurytherma TaxID=1144278 RepID=A0ABQ6H8N8_9GAMM|nr:flagellar filament capping protein FliD [Thalassotalea eurytherma]GLX83125.1 flagellar hook-associated protein 2 [Thalassotalea eurytherma]
MALITSAGVGSGLDLESIISATLDAENLPKLQKFQEKEGELTVELSAVGAVKSSLSSLEDVIEKLADIDNFNKRTATVTQPDSGDLISVTASEDATPAQFNVEVMQLAQGSRAVMADGLFSSVDDVVTATGGTLTYSAGGDTFDVDLAAGATLEELRQAINDANDNFGVTANIINDGTSSKLVLTSNKTGAGNDLVVTNNIAELDNVSTVANAGGAGGLAIATEDQAQDAIIEVDGISITSDTNTFKDAVQDLTIVAQKESENNETSKIVVDYDKTGVESLIEEFITGFNNAMGTIDYHTQAGAPLNGDSTMRSLKAQLISALSTTVPTGDFETIFDAGLGLSKDGALEKESLVRSLSTALTENFDEVGELFASENGIASTFSTLLDNYVASDGTMKSREDGINLELGKLEDDVSNHEYRMEQLEISLRKQYSALDVLIAQMQSSGQYLTAQLASLPGFSTSDS